MYTETSLDTETLNPLMPTILSIHGCSAYSPKEREQPVQERSDAVYHPRSLEPSSKQHNVPFTME